jgi:hypothetical protein
MSTLIVEVSLSQAKEAEVTDSPNCGTRVDIYIEAFAKSSSVASAHGESSTGSLIW